MNETIEKLKNKILPSDDELKNIIDSSSENMQNELFSAAVAVRKKVYANDVYIRGLTELTNYCKNDCFYCGIRKSNSNINRYRLTKDEIQKCCKDGYELGFRTFVLQGGEDDYYTDDIMCGIINNIKSDFPDCAVTLSLGEKSRKTYRSYFDAGADRYLLRHETANTVHYSRLHPTVQSLNTRIECLYNLKDIGFQTGCGFMVGSPFQTTKNLIDDIKFIKEFKPPMVGIGPFIPHINTPFRDFETGSVRKTLILLSIIRLILPNVLLPATTALATVDPNGRKKGILAGANVVMPNLSPALHRADYTLYNNKKSFGTEGAEQISNLEKELNSIGYKISYTKGDFKGSVN